MTMDMPVRALVTGMLAASAVAGVFAPGAYAADPEPPPQTVIMSNEEAEAAGLVSPGFAPAPCYEPGVYYFGSPAPRAPSGFAPGWCGLRL
ncbi:hypothetical protein [Streptomyces sp. NPDC058695]|uniref:hypothetical protein n=1 Tax=Streptomyces sp. NPDC058695 TaxID=3346604 RepID=UPI00366247C6